MRGNFFKIRFGVGKPQNKKPQDKKKYFKIGFGEGEPKNRKP